MTALTREDEIALLESVPPELSVVLPSHNEIGLLGSTVTNLVAGLDDRKIPYEIIIVENGSIDGTLRLARLLSAQIPRVRVLTLPVGNYGAALFAGFVAARGRLVVNFDVDYYDFGFLDAALRAFSSSDAKIVLASKRAPGAKDRRPLTRRFLTAAFAAVLRALVQLEVSDAHGMKVLERESLAPIVDECVLRGSLFDVELVIRAMDSGITVTEIPAVVVERRPPRTSLRARSVESLLSTIRLRSVLRGERAAATAEFDPAPGRRFQIHRP
jgi:glycosyltransferase involved in cell wall biosynthesis